MNFQRVFFKALFVTLLLLLLLVRIRNASNTDNGGWKSNEQSSNTDDNDEEEDVTISNECAAALLTGGGIFGAGAASVLWPKFLAAIGFTSIGVSAGSFASWWQSTMPLVAKNSLFAVLQSIAMTGAGGYTTVAIGSSLGGAASIKFLKSFCANVDESVEKQSAAGKVFSGNLEWIMAAQKSAKWAGKNSKEAKEWAKKVVQLASMWANTYLTKENANYAAQSARGAIQEVSAWIQSQLGEEEQEEKGDNQNIKWAREKIKKASELMTNYLTDENVQKTADWVRDSLQRTGVFAQQSNEDQKNQSSNFYNEWYNKLFGTTEKDL